MTAPTLDQNTRASDLAAHYASLIAGRTILVTGVSPGSLGASFVKNIASAHPTTLILAGRSPDKMQACVSEVKAVAPEVNVKLLTMNLMSLKDVRRAAETVNSWDDIKHIDVLVNNAGIMAVPYTETEDGFEAQFQTNHLSHFLFTNLIIEKLLASPKPRLVHVSSGVHRVGHIRWTDLHFDHGKRYQRWLAYGQSKTANALMGIAFAEKYAQRGLQSFSMCPGVSLTNLSAHGASDFAAFAKDLTEMDNIYGNKWGTGMAAMHYKDNDQGASTHVFASFDPNLGEHNGAFLNDCRLADAEKEEVYPWATSKIDALRLWKVSEELVGQQFAA